MDTNRRDLIMQHWNVIDRELLPELRYDVGTLTSKLEMVLYLLEWVRIEEFVHSSWYGEGRLPHLRSWLANAFVVNWDGRDAGADRTLDDRPRPAANTLPRSSKPTRASSWA